MVGFESYPNLNRTARVRLEVYAAAALGHGFQYHRRVHSVELGSPLGVNGRAVIRERIHHNVIVLVYQIIIKPANSAVLGAEIQRLLVRTENLCGHVGPEIPLVALILLVLIAVRHIRAAVDHKNIPPAPAGGYSVRKSALLAQLGVDTPRPAE